MHSETVHIQYSVTNHAIGTNHDYMLVLTMTQCCLKTKLPFLLYYLMELGDNLTSFCTTWIAKNSRAGADSKTRDCCVCCRSYTDVVWVAAPGMRCCWHAIRAADRGLDPATAAHSQPAI